MNSRNVSETSMPSFVSVRFMLFDIDIGIYCSVLHTRAAIFLGMIQAQFGAQNRCSTYLYKINVFVVLQMFIYVQFAPDCIQIRTKNGNIHFALLFQFYICNNFLFNALRQSFVGPSVRFLRNFICLTFFYVSLISYIFRVYYKLNKLLKSQQNDKIKGIKCKYKQMKPSNETSIHFSYSNSHSSLIYVYSDAIDMGHMSVSLNKTTL